MRIRTIVFGLPLLLVLVALQRASGASRLSCWVVNPLEKIRPFAMVPNDPQRSVELSAARNEFEPFQLALRSEGKDLASVDVEVSDLRATGGAEIANSNITIYFEHFLDLTKPSTEDSEGGLWPDALIPRIDRYANERRNAFPFALPHDVTQPLWVDVFVPPQAPAGRYTGTVRITSAGKTVANVAIRLMVRRFALPSTSSLKSSFGLNGVAALKQHRGRYTDDAELYSITRMYATAALMHRISTHGGSMAPPKMGGSEIEWSAYDAEISPALNGTLLKGNDPLAGARATSVELRTPVSFESDQQRERYWTAWTRHFEKRGWLDRLFLYLWDEPSKQDFTKVLAMGKSSVRADPRIRNLITTPFRSDLADVIRVWVPLVNCLERKPGYDDFCAEAPPIDAYFRQERNTSTSLWTYQSCASHGCNITGGSYFIGWPSYMVDAPGAANRVMEWISWKYHIDGELYFSMNEAYGRVNDPWADIRLFGGNGDGTLFYPGKPARIGGRTDIPVESIRLKLIREGMEDYEYLSLLERLRGREAAEQFASRIVNAPYSWEVRPDSFLKVRNELGETLDRFMQSEAMAGNQSASHGTNGHTSW
jgi:Domain of unknown function (DUF4091)